MTRDHAFYVLSACTYSILTLSRYARPGDRRPLAFCDENHILVQRLVTTLAAHIGQPDFAVNAMSADDPLQAQRGTRWTCRFARASFPAAAASRWRLISETARAMVSRNLTRGGPTPCVSSTRRMAGDAPVM